MTNLYTDCIFDAYFVAAKQFCRIKNTYELALEQVILQDYEELPEIWYRTTISGFR